MLLILDALFVSEYNAETLLPFDFRTKFNLVIVKVVVAMPVQVGSSVATVVFAPSVPLQLFGEHFVFPDESIRL